MKFAYTEFVDAERGGPSFWRPILPIRVRGPAGVVVLDMLVDSGSDDTQIQESTLEALGIPLGDERVELLGIGGGRVEGRVCSATLEFKGHIFPSKVVAADSFDRNFGLLGHRDFFLNFWVGFDSAARVFFVNPSTRRR